MNHSSSRRFSPVVPVMFLAISLGSLIGPSFAQVQTAPSQPSNTAQAKLHYQNAVAAITNNDWKTAKAELLKAKQLAPSNALVHYDLALAYSHTGETHSAQLELNTALRLGLPPAQQEEAKRLNSEWTATAPALPSQKATQQNATTPYAKLDVGFDRFTNKSTGSVILGFPQQSFAIRFVTQCKGDDFSKEYHNPMFYIEKGDAGWVRPSSEAAFLSDGASIQIPPSVLIGNSAVPVYLLRDLIKASSLEGRFDGTQVSFASEQISALRDFVDKTQLEQVGPLWNVPPSIALVNSTAASLIPDNVDGEARWTRRFTLSSGVLAMSAQMQRRSSSGHTSRVTWDSITELSRLGLPTDGNMLMCYSGNQNCYVVTNHWMQDGTDTEAPKVEAEPAIFGTSIFDNIGVAINGPEASQLTDLIIYGWYLSLFRAM